MKWQSSASQLFQALKSCCQSLRHTGSALCMAANESNNKKQITLFMLYPAHSKIGRRNLVLRHSIRHWRHCILSGRNLFASIPERRNANINFNKYFISSGGDRSHIQSVLQSHFVPLRHDWPHIHTILPLLNW